MGRSGSSENAPILPGEWLKMGVLSFESDGLSAVELVDVLFIGRFMLGCITGSVEMDFLLDCRFALLSKAA